MEHPWDSLIHVPDVWLPTFICQNTIPDGTVGCVTGMSSVDKNSEPGLNYIVFSDSSLERTWLWQNDWSWKADASFRGEPPKRTKTSAHCTVLWQNHWSLQYNHLHSNGVLWGRRLGSTDSQTQERKVSVALYCLSIALSAYWNSRYPCNVL